MFFRLAWAKTLPELKQILDERRQRLADMMARIEYEYDLERRLEMLYSDTDSFGYGYDSDVLPLDPDDVFGEVDGLDDFDADDS